MATILTFAPRSLAGLALLGGLGCVWLPEGEVERDAAALEQPLQSDSAVEAEGGSRYVAGVFSGFLRVGDALLQSRGGDDVFLVRLLPDGTVDWARAMGSEDDERAPRVELDAGRLSVIAMTRGTVDCGGGELRSFSGEAFFMCTFDERGRPLTGAAFPTGRP